MQAAYAVGGSLMFALGVNLIIIPLGLYNGGFMGIAQLMRTFVVSVLHVPVPSGVDLSGILYFIINIPLFYMGLKILGKEFAIKTLITVGMQSMFLVVVPIPAVPLIEDYLTACIIGGIIAGTGTGLVLRGRSSGGGQDIIGLCCSKKYPNISEMCIRDRMSFVINFLTGNGAAMGIDGNISYIPWWLVILSMGFAMLVGVAAGYFPSLRAMRLSPLAAIRSE